MQKFIESQGLKKLNPREVPDEPSVSSRLERFIKSSKQKPNTGFQFSKSSIKKIIPRETTAKSEDKVSLSLYQKQLEFSRSYSSYIQQCDKGITRDDLFPENIPKKIPVPEKSKPVSNAEDAKTLFSHLISKPKLENKKIKLTGRGLLQKSTIWCARCSKNHSPDFHFQAKPAKPVTLPIKRPAEDDQDNIDSEDDYSYEDEYEDDGFIEKADDEEKVQKMVRKMMGYDPSMYKDIDRLPTYGMESSAHRVLMEDRYTNKIGAIEDRRELEKIQKKQKYS
jgi:SPT2 chromatin protein